MSLQQESKMKVTEVGKSQQENNLVKQVNNERLLSTAEVAELLNVHENTVYARVRTGILKPVETEGKGYYFDAREIERLLEIENPFNDIVSVVKKNSDKMVRNIANWGYFVNNRESADVFATAVTSCLDEQAMLTSFIERINPFVIFGSYMSVIGANDYSRVLKGRELLWVSESLKNNTVHGELTSSEAVSMLMKLSYFLELGIAKVNERTTIFFVVEINNKKYVLDGTLQQDFATLDKGVVCIELVQAKNILYDDINLITVIDFVTLLNAHDTRTATFKKIKNFIAN